MPRPTFDRIDDLAMDLAAGVCLIADDRSAVELRAALDANPAIRRMWEDTLQNARQVWALYMDEVMAPLPGLEVG